MDREYFQFLGKCLELGEIVNYWHRVKSISGTIIEKFIQATDSKRRAKKDDLEDYFRVFDRTLEAIEDMVKGFRSSGKDCPVTKIIDRFNLDRKERVFIYYGLCERFSAGNENELLSLIEVLAKGKRFEVAELILRYLNPDSKLVKENVLAAQCPRYGKTYKLSDSILNEICGLGTVENDTRKDYATSLHLSGPSEIYNVLSRKVIGQEEAKRVLSIAAFHHYQNIKVENRLKAGNIILIGPTGVGKTYLVRTLAEYLKVPVVFCSANEFSETGYVGKSVSDIIGELWGKADSDSEKAGKGIIFIDEIDKIATCSSILSHHSNRDVSGRSVQEELLDILESSGKRTFSYGPFLHNKVTMDASKILFIAAGAFDGLETMCQRKLHVMGFAVTNEWKNDGYSQIETEDLINYGLIPEFVGRFSAIVPLSHLDKEDLIRVMGEPEDSILSQYREYFRQFGVELEVKLPALEKIAALALERKTGARGLRSILDVILRPYLFNLTGENCDASRIVIDERNCVFPPGKTEIIAHENTEEAEKLKGIVA